VERASSRLVAVWEVGAGLWRHSSGVESLGKAWKWGNLWGAGSMSSVDITVWVVGASLWVNSSWVLVSTGWCWGGYVVLALWLVSWLLVPLVVSGCAVGGGAVWSRLRLVVLRLRGLIVLRGGSRVRLNTVGVGAVKGSVITNWESWTF